MKDEEGVKVRELFLLNNDSIAFEEMVYFVGRQKKTILVVVNSKWELFGYFSPIVEIGVVGEGKFSETHKSKETSEEHSLE